MYYTIHFILHKQKEPLLWSTEPHHAPWPSVVPTNVTIPLNVTAPDKCHNSPRQKSQPTANVTTLPRQMSQPTANVTTLPRQMSQPTTNVTTVS